MIRRKQVRLFAPSRRRLHRDHQEWFAGQPEEQRCERRGFPDVTDNGGHPGDRRVGEDIQVRKPTSAAPGSVGHGGVKIHRHPKAITVVGNAQGIKTMARTAPRPRQR